MVTSNLAKGNGAHAGIEDWHSRRWVMRCVWNPFPDLIPIYDSGEENFKVMKAVKCTYTEREDFKLGVPKLFSVPMHHGWDTEAATCPLRGQIQTIGSRVIVVEIDMLSWNHLGQDHDCIGADGGPVSSDSDWALFSYVLPDWHRCQQLMTAGEHWLLSQNQCGFWMQFWDPLASK